MMIGASVTPLNLALQVAELVHQWLDPASLLDRVVEQQAQIIAYIDDYKLLLIATLALFALLLIFKKSGGSAGSGHAVVEG